MENRRILEIIPLITNGGVESMVLTWIQKIQSENPDNLLFDIATTKILDNNKAEEFRRLKCNVFEIPLRQRKVIKRYLTYKRLFTKRKYKVIHLHTNCAMDFSLLLAGERSGIPVRIAHSHSSAIGTDKKIPCIVHETVRPLFNLLCTIRLACSEQAGRHLFGRQSFILFRNSIDTEQYRFDENLRLVIRNKYNINPHVTVIGHVGNFMYEKNHFKILEVFKEFLNMNPESILLLIGSGVLENTIISQIKNLNIGENVIMTGNIYDVQKYYNAMDAFIFPSFHEGFSVALLEAQCNGLQCYISKELSKEMIITDRVVQLDLKSQSED